MICRAGPDMNHFAPNASEQVDAGCTINTLELNMINQIAFERGLVVGDWSKEARRTPNGAARTSPSDWPRRQARPVAIEFHVDGSRKGEADVWSHSANRWHVSADFHRVCVD